MIPKCTPNIHKGAFQRTLLKNKNKKKEPKQPSSQRMDGHGEHTNTTENQTNTTQID